MNESAKNVIFKVWNVAIYALFLGNVSKSWKCAGVKILTNMMSGAPSCVSKTSRVESHASFFVESFFVASSCDHILKVTLVTDCRLWWTMAKRAPSWANKKEIFSSSLWRQHYDQGLSGYSFATESLRETGVECERWVSRLEEHPASIMLHDETQNCERDPKLWTSLFKK